MASNGHHVAGFEFIDPGMGELAEKEFKAILNAAQKFGTFKENYVASTFSEET